MALAHVHVQILLTLFFHDPVLVYFYVFLVMCVCCACCFVLKIHLPFFFPVRFASCLALSHLIPDYSFPVESHHLMYFSLMSFPVLLPGCSTSM